jgi:hypothetical protein
MKDPVLTYEIDDIACQKAILKESERRRVNSNNYKSLYYTILCSKLSPLL